MCSIGGGDSRNGREGSVGKFRLIPVRNVKERPGWGFGGFDSSMCNDILMFPRIRCHAGLKGHWDASWQCDVMGRCYNLGEIVNA